MPTVDVAANLQRIRERLARACEGAGRPADSVRLIAVTKRIDLDLVAAAVRAGQVDLGENRLQDAIPRQEALTELLDDPSATVRWHFIGHLQRNKAAKAGGKFHLIHGVHSEDLAGRLARRAEALDVVQPILLQVNMTGESQKDGLAPEVVPGVACAVASMPHLELRGLMAMARHGDDERALRHTFAAVRQLRDRAQEACGRPMPELSMGMSGDFESAVLEGSTLVRVGTAIFGPRLT